MSYPQQQIVTFNYGNWSIRYPELAAWVGQPQAQQFFNEAQQYCDNTPCSIVQNIDQRTIFLNQLTAHITALNAPITNEPSSPLVGRISNAIEGSVTVAAQMDVPQGCPQWYAQTKYGIAYWVASAAFRTMHYIPGGNQNAWNPYNPTNRVFF